MGGDGLEVDQRLSLNPAPFSSTNGPSPARVRATTGKDQYGDRGTRLYSLVAVGLPHHHGVGVGGLAGGDHGGLVEDGGDGGDSGHFVCSCGYAGTSAALRLRTSWKLETALGKNMTKRRRVFGRAAEFTVFVRS